VIYDAAIIGTGPAGVSAALNLKIHNKNFIWIGSKSLSDKLNKAERIENYPGLPAITGAELSAAFQAQVEGMGIEIIPQMVNSILSFGDHYALSAGSDFYETKTILLTTGVAAVGTLPGEGELVGRGVSYCATCDGALYRGKTIAVVCNNPRFEHEAAFLAGLAAQVYYFPLYQNPQLSGDNVHILSDRPVGVVGEKRVTGLKLRSGAELAVDGLFCLRDAISLGTLLPDLKTEQGHIAVDRTMATNLPGVFAAGDCTGRPYQYTKAVGEGNVAAHSMLDYLAQQGS
jgi:thioredoxin reductase (NADPH)